MFQLDQVGLIIESAKKQVITQDRQTYDKIYQALEKYLSSVTNSMNPLILGGTMGVNLLLKKSQTLDDYEYELYSENAFWHANEIANLIAEVVSIDYKERLPPIIIVLKTLIPYQRYQIWVDNRILIWLTDLGKSKVKMTDIIKPVITPSFTGPNILVLSPDSQLIDLYRTLYCPNRAPDWETAIHNENSIFQFLISDPQYQKLRTVKGHAENPETELSHSLQQTNQKRRVKIRDTILKKFIQNNPHVVLIGEHALFMIEETQLGEIKMANASSFVIQIISETPESDYQEISSILTALLGSHIPISKVIRPLRIMQDFRLTRTAIRVGDVAAKEQKEVIYIYNSAEYDLIPFSRYISAKPAEIKPNFIQIGNPFVLLRFLLIDFWMLRWIIALGGIDVAYSQKRLKTIMEKVLNIRVAMSSGKDITTIGKKYLKESWKIFPADSSEYIGRYEDEIIAQKKKIIEVKKYEDYYPQKYFLKNSSYRKLRD